MTETTSTTEALSNKSWQTTWLLSLIVGAFGVDRFYLGKVGTGILKLITLGGFGIWYLIDLIIILTGGATDKKKLKLSGTPDKKLMYWLITAAVIIVLAVIGNSNRDDSNSSTSTESKPAVTEVVEEVKETAVEETTAPEPAKPQLTMGQKNALNKAKSYLDYSNFSRTGLIGQLEFEGFSTEDATYAVDNVGADWNAQAAGKAKSYIEYSSFSRAGLIDQLIYEGFTPEEAEYGVTAIGY